MSTWSSTALTSANAKVESLQKSLATTRVETIAINGGDEY